jgi:toxin ParE1/3/4
MRVRFTQRAIDDLTDIFNYIEQENPHAAARVVSRIERLALELGDVPGMGAATEKHGIRRFPVARTRYLIFYEIIENEVAIVHIRHGARSPWAGSR